MIKIRGTASADVAPTPASKAPAGATPAAKPGPLPGQEGARSGAGALGITLENARLRLGQLRSAPRDTATLAAALELVRSGTLPAPTRAEAAMLAARSACVVDGHAERAEVYYVAGRDLDAGAVGADGALLEILRRRNRSREALAIVDRLLAASPQDLKLLRLRAELLLKEANVPDALAAAEAAYQRAERTAGLTLSARNSVKMTLGWATYRAAHPDRACALFREVLQSEPERLDAHNAIAELVLPDFQAACRPQIEAHFAAANDAYQRGDYAAAAASARAILALDGSEGLAHKLLVLASRCQAVAAAELESGGPKLVEPLATQESRTALVRQLEQVAARARVGDEERPGRPADLFPDWPALTELQRATVAWSILGFARLIPVLIEVGATYRLVAPGTSATQVDAEVRRDNRNAFGRYSYAVRGWQHQRMVVTGLERLADIARGEDYTVTHEFAHLAEMYMRVCGRNRNDASADALDKQLAALSDQITPLYSEAKAQQNGQALLDAYSGNNEHEYFAQGMMAYLNPADGAAHSAKRLYGRNPNLWRLAAELVELLEEFPPLVGPVQHAPVGEEATAGALAIDELRRATEEPRVRAACEQLLSEWQALYLWQEPARAAEQHRALMVRAGRLLSGAEQRPA